MNGSGSIPGGAIAAAALCAFATARNPALAAAASEPRPPRTETSVEAILDSFGLDLYRRLASGPAGENLFFSPFSAYSALAMTAEGARHETAEEMGRALHLAAAFRRQGADAAARPWDFAPVHAGLGKIMAELHHNAGAVPELAARIDSLRKALADANGAARQAEEHGDWEGTRAQNDLARALAAELNAVLPQVDRYELRMANALWSDARYAIAPEFLHTLAAFYDTGGVRAVDYRHDAERARERINAWVAGQTAQRIHDLLPPGSVDPLTRLVLTNAIWFKGEWAEMFDAKSTQDAPFQLAGGTTARAPLMHRELEGTRYAAFRADGSVFPTPREISGYTLDDPTDPKFYPGAGGFQLAELLYKGGDLSMVILLPESAGGLAALERQLDPEQLARWMGRLEPRRTNTFLPRFRLEQGRELREPLEAMGMLRAFLDPSTGRGAQFDGMTASANLRDALFVSAVLHEAFLEVNEKGTEAAAATAVVAKAIGEEEVHVRTRPFVPTFRADRPFLFLIRDTRSEAILFMGRFSKP